MEDKDSVVISAFDTAGKERVAIKKLVEQFRNVTYAKRMFRKLRLISHKSIIGLYDLFTPATSLENFKDVYIWLQS